MFVIYTTGLLTDETFCYFVDSKLLEGIVVTLVPLHSKLKDVSRIRKPKGKSRWWRWLQAQKKEGTYREHSTSILQMSPRQAQKKKGTYRKHSTSILQMSPRLACPGLKAVLRGTILTWPIHERWRSCSMKCSSFEDGYNCDYVPI